MTDNRRQRDSNDEPIPEHLKSDLAALFQPPESIPDDIDEQILYDAREHLAASRRSIRWGRIAAIAAGIVLVLWLERAVQPTPNLDAPPISPPMRLASREDIDGSGRVDILDAFALARRLEAGESPKPAWDFNGDGRVDAVDVDAVAMAAVRLDGGAS